jgi:hypothetical protein
MFKKLSLFFQPEHAGKNKVKALFKEYAITVIQHPN